MLDKIREFFLRDWTLEEKVLLLADVCLAGVLIGMICSPFKGGLFSHNVIGSQNEESYFNEEENEEE